VTPLLSKAFEEAAKLSEQEQTAFANWMLAELAASERRWEKAFEDSQDLLAQLADEALAKHHAGQTRELDPEKL